jgi:hypothetical protein
MGYTNGYVTVDNADWYMDVVLQEAVKAGKKVNHANLKRAYIDALWDSIVFCDDLARKVIGRSPKHVLLLHKNDLAALYVKDLVDYIRSKGWAIISPQEAYQDPIASVIPDTLVNNNGRIAAIAHAQGYVGQKVDFYQNTREVDILFEQRNAFE